MVRLKNQKQGSLIVCVLKCCNKVFSVSFVLILLTPTILSAGGIALDPDLLKRLQDTIIRQQEELNRQAEQIRQQSELLRTLQRQIEDMQRAQDTQKTHPSTVAIPTSPGVVTLGSDRHKITLSGQINRAINVISDGSGTDIYHVDNNASNSRLRIVGSARIDDDLSLGTRIEFAVAPDLSSLVSQTNRVPGTWFDQRWTELSIASKSFGKISLGKGDTASNTSAEMDLSKTDVVQYATLSDIAGGMFFREKAYPNRLTSIKIGDVFNSRDGLSRQSRLRYDTPQFYGFNISASVVSNQRYDLAVFYSGESDIFKTAGAFAVSDPNLPESGLQYDGSLSILHKQTGLNITLSGGLLKRDNLKDAQNVYAKLGWLANLIGYGYTAFGVDYTYSGNLPFSNDRGYSISAAVVQNLKKINSDMYLQYRIHSLNLKSAPPVSDINVGTFGMRVRF
ncbi:MAG: porin [Thermodesulfovibrionales bacterium]